MPRLGFLLLLSLHLACDRTGLSTEANESPGTAPSNPEASDPEASDPEASNPEGAANVLDEQPISRCGMGGTLELQRTGCERDTQCVLRRTDYLSCWDNRCGSPVFSYNCEFAARLAEFCEQNSACDEGLRDLVDLGVQCGGGASAPMEAFCDEGVCRSRVRQAAPQSRLVSVNGPLSEREVERFIRRARRRVEACLLGEGERNAEANVALTFEITAPAAGGIGAVAHIHGDADAARVACAMNEIRSLDFPPSDDGETRVRYRFAPTFVRSECDDMPH
ncbi:MAG: hypothetical protein ACI9KE_000595 [Polyangiales bacterium]|jgi:hypothetical protein